MWEAVRELISLVGKLGENAFIVTLVGAALAFTLWLYAQTRDPHLLNIGSLLAATFMVIALLSLRFPHESD